MFKRERQYNIISGTVANDFILQRSKSCATQLENFNKNNRLLTESNQKLPKLGQPKDRKQYQYSYGQSSLLQLSNRKNSQTLYPASVLSQTQPMRNEVSSNIPITKTMMNYVSTGYNIINHSDQIETARVANKNTFVNKMYQVYKKSPLTEHLHRARLLAPNYHQDYNDRTEKLEFYKKGGLCTNVCDIQKTYGQAKYFRKYK